MNERRMTGMAWLAAFWLVLAMIFLGMCSCSTKKTVTETVYVHDTISVHYNDTIKDVVVKTKTDTVREVEMHTYTLNNVGDTVKEIHHYHNTEKVIIVDSTNRYKAVVDSLRQVLDKQQTTVTKVVKKGPAWWEYAIVVGVAFLVCVLVLKSRMF